MLKRRPMQLRPRPSRRRSHAAPVRVAERTRSAAHALCADCRGRQDDSRHAKFRPLIQPSRRARGVRRGPTWISASPPCRTYVSPTSPDAKARFSASIPDASTAPASRGPRCLAPRAPWFLCGARARRAGGCFDKCPTQRNSDLITDAPARHGSRDREAPRRQLPFQRAAKTPAPIRAHTIAVAREPDHIMELEQAGAMTTAFEPLAKQFPAAGLTLRRDLPPGRSRLGANQDQRPH